MKGIRRIPTALLSVAIIFTSCNKEEFKTEEQANPREFKVNMTDAPGDYEGLLVEIESIEVYNETEGWINLNNESQFVDVLDLTNDVEMQLAIQQNMAIGTYSKLKVKFGDTHKLTLKSTLEIGGVSSTSSVTVDIFILGEHEFELVINEEINSEQGVDLLIDFDVAQSVIKSGDAYVLKPSLKIIQDRSTGIEGEVKGTASASILLTNGSDSLSAYTNAEGHFLLRGMAEGTYDLVVTPIMEDDGQIIAEKRIDGVVVREGKIKSAGTIRF